MNMDPLPLEKELRIESIKRHITELPRDELIESLASAIDTLTRMTHQTKQLLAYIDILEARTHPAGDSHGAGRLDNRAD
jgi:hypothetical protein